MRVEFNDVHIIPINSPEEIHLVESMIGNVIWEMPPQYNYGDVVTEVK